MKSDDTDAFTQFVQASSPGLLHMAWLLCGDPHRAEELVQESLERVYLKWGKVRTGQPLAYTRRVLVNLNTDRWRRTRKEVLTFDGETPESRGPSDRETVEDRDLVIRLLRQLPPRERQVVVLRHYADMSEREVADLLGVSLGTVKSTASRGLSNLRDAMNQNEESRS